MPQVNSWQCNSFSYIFNDLIIKWPVILPFSFAIMRRYPLNFDVTVLNPRYSYLGISNWFSCHPSLSSMRNSNRAYVYDLNSPWSEITSHCRGNHALNWRLVIYFACKLPREMFVVEEITGQYTPISDLPSQKPQRKQTRGVRTYRGGLFNLPISM